METREPGRPTVAGAYAHAWSTLKARPGRLVLILLVLVILQAPANAFARGATGSLLLGLYQLFVVGPVTFGLSYCFLLAVRGQDPEVGDLFAPFQRRYGQAVVASLLLPIVLVISALPMAGVMALATVAGKGAPLLVLAAVAFFALPILASVRLSFVPYLLVGEQRSAIDALGESWARTQPVQLQIFGVEILAIPVMLAGLALLIVGVIPAGILVSLALATLYDDVSPEEDDAQE